MSTCWTTLTPRPVKGSMRQCRSAQDGVVLTHGVHSEYEGDTWRGKPAARYCCTVLAPPAIATSPSPAAARACCNADSMPSVTNVNVVPPCRPKASRGWCVSTKTGTWYGGSSPTSPATSRPISRSRHRTYCDP